MKNSIAARRRNTKDTVKSLNSRQILVYFIAVWLFTYASTLFGYFRDVPFLKVLMKGDSASTMLYIKSRNWGTSDLVAYASFVNETWIIGLGLAFLVSLYIAWIRYWWWMNSVIAFILVYGTNFACAHFIYNRSGLLFSTVYNFPIAASINSFLAIGVLSSITGCFLFFSPKVVRFIEKPM